MAGDESRKEEDHRSAALDGIRGIAIIGVLLTHASHYFGNPGIYKWLAPLVFGWAGVDLFFGLSGYLITGILIRTRGSQNRASSFYARRALRIAPIYYITLGVIFGVAVFLPWVNSVLPRPGWDRACYLFYLQNMPQLWHSHLPAYNILSHFWSLAVEEQFYLVWPLIVWTLPEKYVVRLCPILMAAAFGLRYWVVTHAHGIHFWWMLWTPTRGAEALLAGSLLAIVTRRYGRVPKSLLAAFALAGFGVLLAIAIVQRVEFVDTEAGPYMYTIGYTGINLLSVALIGSTRYAVPFLIPILRSSVLRTFGKYSYGVYVYHFPLVVLTDRYVQPWIGPSFQGFSPVRAIAVIAGLIAATMGVAWLSFRFVESPFLALKDRFSPVYATAREEHVLVGAAASDE